MPQTVVSFGSDSFFRLSRTFVQLPEHIQPFQGSGIVTGDAAGGTSSILFNFNPDSRNDYQPYVAIQTISLFGDIADPGNWYGAAPSDGWEDNNQRRVISLLEPKNTTATRWQALQRLTQYVGRGTAGNANSLQFYGSNVNTSAVEIHVRGWISELPFQPPDNLSA
jgi:hypothetical protein